MRCFNCQQDGHIARDCQWSAHLTPGPRPLHDPMAIYRRDPAEISARYSEWADQIRADMKWHRTTSPRAKAAQQAAESRASRPLI